jgi:heme-degrading monooxygenase HmoA
MLQISDVKYAMQFNERCKRGQPVIALKMIADFYNSNIGRVKGFKGYLLRESLKDPPSIVNITFWDTKEDMNSYYNGLNYSGFLEKVKPLLEELPEKSESAYSILDYLDEIVINTTLNSFRDFHRLPIFEHLSQK